MYLTKKLAVICIYTHYWFEIKKKKNCRGSAVKCGIHIAQLYNFFQLYVYSSTTENVIIMSSNKFSIE